MRCNMLVSNQIGWTTLLKKSDNIFFIKKQFKFQFNLIYIKHISRPKENFPNMDSTNQAEQFGSQIIGFGCYSRHPRYHHLLFIVAQMSVILPTSRFAYIQVVSPTQPSRFASMVRVNSRTLKLFCPHLQVEIFSEDGWTSLPAVG